ncbi:MULTISPECIES: hybrid sensor histidine kinase/response regulator [Halomicrobium]|uniref:histidine kinase n=2 Tax=Halomicrobium mukohataei TaxID=57705 RepID=C7P3W2_HALMD|nr:MULTISPECIES: ATP-binding protein [Halomicrobium]ACV47784.1 multi-sensor signal transduction histidine kinase [Halomicrobium mukohataei DSM 12286]QCD66233.1 GAF domain-containing protein [Halomicrobium mukohataei]QFR21039.1 GAF domain-containing protein [Halomicrobium sp. ZPS1]
MDRANSVDRTRAPRGDTVDVLYVDPDTDSTVRDSFGDSGPFRVTHVADAATALAHVTDGSTDCVVSEQDLPDGSGLSLLRSIRRRAPSLPFVLFTDDGSETVASEAIDADVTGYLRRTPLEEQLPTLVTTVTEAVSRPHEQSAILDRMTDAFFALDVEWRFTYLNERAREIVCDAADVDRSIDDLVGTRIWDLLPEVVDTEFYDRYTEAMDEQRVTTFEAEYEPLGTWFEVRAYPSVDGLSVYFQDVTDRKHRIETLRERERILKEMYRVVSEKTLSFEEQVDRLLSIGQSVLGTDYGALSSREGDEYVFEVVRDPTGDTQPGDRVALDETNCERAIVTEETLVLEDIARDAPELAERAGYTDDGIACYLGTPVVVEDEVYGTFCFYDREPRTEPFSDWEIALVELLGNWVSYEQERRRHQNEIARERNRLEEFASVVSHDLRNPLSVALGRIDVARETGAEEHFDAIERSLQRMDTLIEDILSVARDGRTVSEPTPVDIETVAEDAWAVVESDEATLRIDVDDRFLGDATRLQQLLENLFRNAVQHAGRGVVITVGPLEEGTGFYVADDGPGIPEDERDDVFQSAYTTIDDGTGFGLKIVSEIAEAHGGYVTVTDGDDGGARFEIRDLPLA